MMLPCGKTHPNHAWIHFLAGDPGLYNLKSVREALAGVNLPIALCFFLTDGPAPVTSPSG